MITGAVNADLEAHIPLFISPAPGPAQMIDAVIDTGFSEHLALGADLVASLELPFLCMQAMMHPDGTVRALSVHTGVVVWDGQPRIVEVIATEASAVVGMKMLAGNELCLRAVAGGLVWIDTVP